MIRPAHPLLAPGQPLPIPPDFPIHWASPTQARQLWMQEQMHYPDPVPAVFVSASHELIASPFNKAAERYALPIRLSALCVNNYLYVSFAPEGAPPDFVLRALNGLNQIAPGLFKLLMNRATAGRVTSYMAQLQPVMARLGEHWTEDWQPKLKQHLAYWRSFNLHTATLPGLISHLDQSLLRLAQVWELHWLIVLPSFLTLSLFEELYRQLFGQAEALAAYRLLQGFDNKFLEADRALWQLSRQALSMPKVRSILETHSGDEVISTLAGSPEGDIFLAELRRYLDEYGQRGSRGDGLCDVSWIENPAPVIKSLKDYVAQPDRDLEAALRARAAEREQWVAQARERLRQHSRPTVERFEMLLKAAQSAAFLHEEHNYWIDQGAQYQLRRLLLELGQRFTNASLITKPDEVFYLTLGEIRSMAHNITDPETVSVSIALVCKRRAEGEHFRAIKPPPFIGAVPLMEPPDEPLGRSLGKVFGGLGLPRRQHAAEPGLVRGQAASLGVARGRARIIRSLAEAHHLQPGEVLVAESTLPAWTPLFAIASAVVTEVGGSLSHTAVVAREYGIPAVVGARAALTLIGNGQRVEVDGGRGVVRLLET